MKLLLNIGALWKWKISRLMPFLVLYWINVGRSTVLHLASDVRSLVKTMLDGYKKSRYLIKNFINFEDMMTHIFVL